MIASSETMAPPPLVPVLAVVGVGLIGGSLALALKRFGDADAAKVIMGSIKERSVTSEELGMFWRETELSWWWYRAPIETQALMIEAFDEVAERRVQRPSRLAPSKVLRLRLEVTPGH